MKLSIMWESDYRIDVVNIPKRIEKKLSNKDLDEIEDILAEELFDGWHSWHNHCMFGLADYDDPVCRYSFSGYKKMYADD